MVGGVDVRASKERSAGPLVNRDRMWENVVLEDEVKVYVCVEGGRQGNGDPHQRLVMVGKATLETCWEGNCDLGRMTLW